jgi:RNA polymerase sigma-70 factor (ECF subfamily)
VKADDRGIAPVGPDADDELVAAIAVRSSDALARLYDRYAATMLGLACRITGRLEDAEEVVQDVFAQVWRQAARYDAGRATVAGWLVMVTRTRALDRLRARRARPDAEASSPGVVPPVAASDPDPEQVAISDREARQVRAALVSLSEAQRSLVELAYYEGLTHAQIAERTGLPLGTVKTRLRAAAAVLREALR